jgi:BirA family biotin operon repressor/biotin-[acetyl-CoA-carboxylase] ligase
MWGEVIRYAELTSTNDLARDHAARGAAEGTTLVADFQVAGRGRQGRDWIARPGTALLCSVILRPPTAVSRSAWLTLLAGVAAARAVRKLTDLEVVLKWPNDLRYEGNKLAGVLTETFRGEDSGVAVVGLGLNLTQTAEDFEGELAETATSLQLAAGRAPSRDDLLKVYRAELQELYGNLCDGRIALLTEAWLELDETIGRQVSVESAEGQWHGRASRIDEQGALWIEDAVGDPRRIVAGDVSIRFED